MYNLTPADAKRLLVSGEARLGVVGLGYVGLPLALAFCLKNIKVVGIDTNKAKVDSINNGEPEFYEPGLKSALVSALKKKLFLATTDYQQLKGVGFIIVTVGTPLKRVMANLQQQKPAHLPDLTQVRSACRQLAKIIERNTIIVFKSTLPPGTTEQKLIPLIENYSGLKCNSDFGIAFSPERTVEGKALVEFKTLPKIVGASDNKTCEIVATVFSILNPKVIRVSSIKVAEMVKLMDNVYRDVNIALANEFALACEALGIDVMEAIQVANDGYPRNNILTPGAGVGGSCLPKDPYILLAEVNKYGVDLKLPKLAREINSRMPEHMVELILKVLKRTTPHVYRPKQKLLLRGIRIAILGLAYKSNTSDLRETPAIPLIQRLKKLGAEISAYDPYVMEADVKRMMIANKITTEFEFNTKLEPTVQNSDCLVVVTDHPEFYTIDLAQIRKLMRRLCIVDGRHVIDRRIATDLKFKYVAVGATTTTTNCSW